MGRQFEGEMVRRKRRRPNHKTFLGASHLRLNPEFIKFIRRIQATRMMNGKRPLKANEILLIIRKNFERGNNIYDFINY